MMMINPFYHDANPPCLCFFHQVMCILPLWISADLLAAGDETVMTSIAVTTKNMGVGQR